jgi:hypothetical protein
MSSRKTVPIRNGRIMNSFLITFKPDTESPRLGWSLKSVQDLARKLVRRGSVTDAWRFRNQRDVKPGDRVFLLMQGKHGPALIGYGTADERNGVENGRSWRNINFERLVDPGLTSLDVKGISSRFEVRHAGFKCEEAASYCLAILLRRWNLWWSKDAPHREELAGM